MRESPSPRACLSCRAWAAASKGVIGDGQGETGDAEAKGRPVGQAGQLSSPNLVLMEMIAPPGAGRPTYPRR